MASSLIPSLYFRIDIKERLDALLQLTLDLFLRSLDNVQRHMCLAPVFQLDRTFFYACYFALGQQPQTVHQR